MGGGVVNDVHAHAAGQVCGGCSFFGFIIVDSAKWYECLRLGEAVPFSYSVLLLSTWAASFHEVGDSEWCSGDLAT